MQMTINVPDNLPPAIVQQYIYNIESQMTLMAQLTTTSAIKKRVVGQFRGKIKMASDFDEELPADFWLSETT